MKREFSNERPPLYERDSCAAAKIVNFDIREEQEGEYQYSYCSVSVKFGQWNYDGIVNAIITAEYPNDRMQAVINNYLLATREEGGEPIEEFLQMQAWRTMAKATAHEVLGE